MCERMNERVVFTFSLFSFCLFFLIIPHVLCIGVHLFKVPAVGGSASMCDDITSPCENISSNERTKKLVIWSLLSTMAIISFIHIMCSIPKRTTCNCADWTLTMPGHFASRVREKRARKTKKKKKNMQKVIVFGGKRHRFGRRANTEHTHCLNMGRNVCRAVSTAKEIIASNAIWHRREACTILLAYIRQIYWIESPKFIRVNEYMWRWADGAEGCCVGL